MKVLIVNKFLHPNGGSETSIFEIGTTLEAMGHEVQFFGMEHKGRIVGNRAEIYTPDMDFHGGGIRGKLSKLTYPFKIIHSKDAARRITRVLKDFNPDVVHFNNINFQLTPSVIEAVADYDIHEHKEIVMVYTAHDSQWVCPNHLLLKPDGTRCFECRDCNYSACVKNRCIHGSRLRSILGAFEAGYYHKKRTYDLIDHIIAPSGFMKDILESDPMLKGKCTVLHNFIPAKEEDKKTPDTGKLPDGRYVLYFGRYSAEKGIKTLVKCVKELPDISFVFAGSGPMEAEVRALPNVREIGFTTGNALKELIGNAVFTVFPSECHENCSFTVMESISYGTPIIASDTGGTPELVRDKENGLLFEAGNAGELKTAIQSLWNNDEMLNTLKMGCRDTHFMTVREYCDIMIKEIYK